MNSSTNGPQNPSNNLLQNERVWTSRRFPSSPAQTVPNQNSLRLARRS